MEKKHPENKPLGGGLRFVVLWCWLTVIACSIGVVSGLYNEPGDVIDILMAGLALYVALGLRARSNAARLVLIVILAAGAASAVLLALIRISQAVASSAPLEGVLETASFIGLYFLAPLLLACASYALLKEVTCEPVRQQFGASRRGSGPGVVLTKQEQNAVAIGFVLGLLALLVQLVARTPQP